LTFYELDLGLNHVVRKYSEPLEEHGNFLITGTAHLATESFSLWICLVPVPQGNKINMLYALGVVLMVV